MKQISDHVRFRIQAILLTISICLGLWGSIALIASRTVVNCERIHALYLSLDKILIENGQQIDQSYVEGRLSLRERKFYREVNDKNRKILKDGDCAK